MEPAEVEPCLQRLAQLLGQRVAAPPRRLEAFIGNRLIPVDEGMVLQRRGKAHGEEQLAAGRPSPRLAKSGQRAVGVQRSEEHTSELQSLMRISYAVFCLKKKKTNNI